MPKFKCILVTGGAGFIGGHLIRHLLADFSAKVVNVDKLSYAGNLDSLKDVSDNPGYFFERVDLVDERAVESMFEKHQPDAVIHLAAESHVDRSIGAPSAFVHSNVIGTLNLLNSSRRHWQQLDTESRHRFRFLHVSTDEVYGSLGPDELPFNEQASYDPRSPYAASKASSDHLVRAWHTTYGLPTVITNCSNNYGQFQYPEKLIPMVILNAVRNQPIPVYGDGQQIRDWLHVDDHVKALVAALHRGKPGETYNVGANNERSNLEVVHSICTILDQLAPTETLLTKPNGESFRQLVQFVEDRPGHDRRYAIDSSKAKSQLGWTAKTDFQIGLEQTVRWYLANSDWWQKAIDDAVAIDRLGLQRTQQLDCEPRS